MKTKLLLTVLCFSALVLFGSQVLSPSNAFVPTVQATVDIDPDVINLNRRGNWITVYIMLPEDYNVSGIDRSAILLKDPLNSAWAGISQEWSSLECDVLMVKFDSAELIDYLSTRLNHMGGNRAFIELAVTGQLTNGTSFEGKDTVEIMDPIKE